jgi:hypothetical protein
MTEQQQIRQAIAKLTDVLVGIARTADERNRERCPYKTVELRCTFQSGCQNQRRAAGTIHCTGDHLLLWEPAPRDQRPGTNDL